MADVIVPPMPAPLGEPIYLAVELSKLSLVPGDVLLIQTPPDASLDQVMHVVSRLHQLAPDGVHVACIDSNYRLTATNVPEVVAMMQKPDVTH